MADACNNSEAQRIPEDKEESIFCSCNEALACESDLDVGIAVEELDESFKAGSTTLKAVNCVSNAPILSCTAGLHMTIDILKHQSHKLNKSKDECSESN